MITARVVIISVIMSLDNLGVHVIILLSFASAAAVFQSLGFLKGFFVSLLIHVAESKFIQEFPNQGVGFLLFV